MTISTALENPSTRTLMKCWVAVWQSSGPPNGALAIVDRDHAVAFEQFGPERLLECGLVVAVADHRAFMAIDQDRTAIDECHAKRDGSTGNYLRTTRPRARGEQPRIMSKQLAPGITDLPETSASRSMSQVFSAATAGLA